MTKKEDTNPGNNRYLLIVSKRYTNLARDSRKLSLSLLKNIMRHSFSPSILLTVNAKIIIKLFRSHHDQNLCGLLIYAKITITQRPPTCTTVNDAFVHFNLIMIQLHCCCFRKIEERKNVIFIKRKKKSSWDITFIWKACLSLGHRCFAYADWVSDTQRLLHDTCERVIWIILHIFSHCLHRMAEYSIFKTIYCKQGEKKKYSAEKNENVLILDWINRKRKRQYINECVHKMSINFFLFSVSTFGERK